MPAATLKPICAIFGKSTYLRREALDRIIRRELDGGDPALDLQRVDGAQSEASAILDDVRTFSLLGGRRVVVVESADAFVTKFRAVLERFAANPSEAGCLVLVCNNFDGRTKLFKAVKKVGEVVECKPLQGRPLTQWIISRAKDPHGKRMGAAAAARLQEQAGSGQEGLDQEISKLSLYVGGRMEITPADVDAVVGHYREQTVFAVMDAVSEGNARTALQEWHQVLATDRAAGGRAVGGLAWGVRRMLGARRRFDAGESPHALARSFWTDPDIMARRLEHRTAAQREDQLLGLLDADLRTKTGASTFDSAVERFIVQSSCAPVAATS